MKVPPIQDVFRVVLQSGMLLLVFFGAGLYLRGLWVYLRARKWLHEAERQDTRRRYRSSAIAALLREPGLREARRQCGLAFLGLPMVAVGGVLYNALQLYATR